MPNPFSPLPTDGAIEILRQIFGPVMDSIVAQSSIAQAGASVTAGASMLGAAFAYFNSGVLFFTTIIMSYVVIFGISNSANDGEVLGNKWSTFYTPLRTFGAAAMLIPTASGYSGIQIFLLMITSWSIGFGSNMWTAVLDKVLSTQMAEIVTTSVANDKTFEELAMNAIRMRVCAYATTKAYQAVTGDTSTSLQLFGGAAPPAPTTTILAGTQVTSTSIFYAAPNWPGSGAICGSINVTDTYNVPTLGNVLTFQQTNDQVINQTATNLHNALIKVRWNYTLGLFAGCLASDTNCSYSGNASSSGPSLAPVVQNIIDTVENNASNASINATTAVALPIQALRQQMVQAMVMEVGNQLSASNSSVVAQLGEGGWIYAGSLYKEISSIKDTVSHATQSSYSYMPGVQNLAYKLSGNYLPAFTGITANYDTVVQQITQKVLAAPQDPSIPASATKAIPTDSIQTSFKISDFAGGGDGITDSIKHFLSAIPTHIVAGVVSHLSNTDGDPIWAIKDMGDDIRLAIETAIISKIAAQASLESVEEGARVASNESVLGNNAAALGGVAVGIIHFIVKFMVLAWDEMRIGIYTILYAGYYMSIWVPAIPFFVFTIGVAGWAVFVVEMLAAGSLWMAAHTAPAREDSFIGSQTQGYMLVMSGFFRPALMVLGLVASIAVAKPLIQYLNAAFKLMFLSTTADSYVGVTGIAGYILLYCTMLFALLSLIFALPQSLPDRILKWVGAGIGDMGEQGTMGKIESSSSGQARAAQQHGSRREDAKRAAGAGKDNATIEKQLNNQGSKADIEGQGGQSRKAGQANDFSTNDGGGNIGTTPSSGESRPAESNLSSSGSGTGTASSSSGAVESHSGSDATASVEGQGRNSTNASMSDSKPFNPPKDTDTES